MFRVLTVAREFGSGGGKIARRVAEELQWTLLDNALIREVARVGRVAPDDAKRYDERVDSWWRRLHFGALEAACIAAGAAPADAQLVDAESTIAAITQRVISRAAAQGNCVIVGRGAQCVLQTRADVFHVFVYGAWDERVSRVRSRMRSVQDIENLVQCTDRERADYIRTHYGCDWKDPHLYNMMISSQGGVEAAVATIVDTIRNSGVLARIRIAVPLRAS